MPINKSSRIVSHIIDTGKLDALEVGPFPIKNEILPVLDVNPKHCFILRQASASAAGATTVYTTDNSKERDFYLCGLVIGYNKDAANDNGTGNLGLAFATVDNKQSALCHINCITLTAQSGTISITYPIPLKIDKNSTISLGAVTLGAGIFLRSGTIWGYYA